MFSFFRKKPLQQSHPLFGPLIYRANKNKSNQLAGFWEGKLDLGLEEPTQLLIWGEAETHPHPKQAALFNRVVEQIEDYVAQSKEGLWQHIQEEEPSPVAKGTWTLNHLYFQAYPMSARLQQDLPVELQDGVAWGLAFDIEGLLVEGQQHRGYSALVGEEWHPVFPFTYY